MLTKKEREEIAERFRNYDKAEYITLYSGMYDGLLGEHVPKKTTVKKDRMELASRILELCDTSNMIELPLDKDGEVIRAGDTVYDKDGNVAEVGGYYYNNGTCKIIIPYGQNGCYINVLPNELTHKKPVTIASLVEELRSTLCAAYISGRECEKILHIADQLESLGDSNE